MRILIAGGGTGGHFFPALAVAETLKQQDAGHLVRFVGSRAGIEARYLPNDDFPISFIKVRGLMGGSKLKRLAGLAILPVAMFQCLWLLVRFRPQVVVGVGGYASGPLVFLAALLRFPTMILEQNSVPGRTNRILGKIVRKVVVNLPAAKAYFPAHKIEVLGNPIRPHVLENLRKAGRERDWPKPDGGKLHLFVVGGSQGALFLNQTMPKALAMLGADVARISILHQCGPAWTENTREAYTGIEGLEVQVKPFIDDMASAYSWADLIVGRAGAGVLAELAVAGVPSLLIPFPFAADDHQMTNAESLAGEGAAVALAQQDAAPEKIAEWIGDFLSGERSLLKMARQAIHCGKADAADHVVSLMMELSRGKREP